MQDRPDISGIEKIDATRTNHSDIH
jgi:hypothetical protein